MNKIKLCSIGLTTIIVLSIFFYACKNESDLYPIPKNQPLILNSSKNVDIRASDVSSSLNSIIRKIEIIDKRNNSVFDTFIISLSCDDPKDNIYEKLKLRTLSGTLKIENNNIILGKSHAINGLVSEDQKLSNYFYSSENGNPMYKIAQLSCTASNVLNCVENRINSMNLMDYGICLATAPACYAALWAGCTYEICIGKN